MGIYIYIYIWYLYLVFIYLRPYHTCTMLNNIRKMISNKLKEKMDKQFYKLPCTDA